MTVESNQYASTEQYNLGRVIGCHQLQLFVRLRLQAVVVFLSATLRNRTSHERQLVLCNRSVCHERFLCVSGLAANYMQEGKCMQAKQS